MIRFSGLNDWWTRPALMFGLELTIKATVLLTLALLVHRLLGRRRVLSLSAIWNATLVGLLILPPAVMAVPRLQILCLPASAKVPPFSTENDESRLIANNGIASPPAPGSSFEHKLATASPPTESSTRLQALSSQLGRNVASARTSAPVWPWTRLGWASLAILAYGSGALLLALRLACSLAAVRRMLKRSEAIEESAWTASVERWALRLGIRRRVRVVTSQEVTVPIVVGVLRPTIVLPRDLASALRHIDAVALHELAHVKRGDYGWNLVLRLVQLIYWPHPLVWLLTPVLASVREQACDDFCVHGLGGALRYRSTLLEIAAARLRRPRHALGMAMARPSNLGRRLAWIDVSQGQSDCVLRWPWRTGSLVYCTVATAVLGAFQPARAARPADEPQKSESQKAGALSDKPLTPGIAEILVTAHETGKPIEGALVLAALNLERLRLKTDTHGVARLDLTRGLLQESFIVTISAEGYVQQRFVFSNIDTRYPHLPGRFKVELRPGTESFGGIVKNEQGKPIAGATAALWGWLDEKKDPNELAYMVEATTDQQGRWRTKSLRRMLWVNLYLSHPDYLADGTYHPRRFGDSDAPPPSFDSLQKGTDEQVMSRGVEIQGRVLDEGGKPLPGATVGWFEEQEMFFDALSKITADAEGRFRFPHARPGKLHLLAKAKAHAPDIVTIQTGPDTKPIEFRLGPGRVMEGVVLDNKDQPIPGAFVNADTWRGFRCLGAYLKTDQTGRFLWLEAPPGDVQMNASKAGYSFVVQQKVSVSDDRIVFRLHPTLSINGKVTDEVTGQLIRDRLTVEVGIPDPRTGQVAWLERDGAFAIQGNLQVSLDGSERATYLLRISGADYEPVISRKFRSDEQFVTYDVKLTKRAADEKGEPEAK